MGDNAENWQFDAASIPELTANGRLDEIKPAVNRSAAGHQNQDKVMFNSIADVDEGLRRGGKVGAEAGEDFAEHGNDFDEEENRNENSHDCHNGRIHHGGLNLLTQ